MITLRSTGPWQPTYPTYVSCRECGRVFDLRTFVDADEWHYGHDCEE
jgi:hypothetical protein